MFQPLAMIRNPAGKRSAVFHRLAVRRRECGTLDPRERTLASTSDARFPFSDVIARRYHDDINGRGRQPIFDTLAASGVFVNRHVYERAVRGRNPSSRRSIAHRPANRAMMRQTLEEALRTHPPAKRLRRCS